MSRTASTSSPAAPLKSEPQPRPSPTRPMDPAASSANGSGQRVHLAPRGLFHVVELLLELGELAGHRPHLADLVRDLGRLVHDHLGSLDHAADVEQGVGRPCAREHQDGDQRGRW